MNDPTVALADRLERKTMKKVAGMYPAALSPVLEKHEKTLDKLDELMQKGATGRARALVRQSGLLRDVASALAGVGSEAVGLIRSEMSGIREAVLHESQDQG